MFQEQDFQAISEAIVYDPEGHKLGRVGRLYVDDETGQPSWVTVHTGMFGTAESFVPLDDAVTLHDGRLDVSYSKAQIKDGPRVDGDAHLDIEDEAELYRYYGLDYAHWAGHDVSGAHPAAAEVVVESKAPQAHQVGIDPQDVVTETLEVMGIDRRDEALEVAHVAHDVIYQRRLRHHEVPR